MALSTAFAQQGEIIYKDYEPDTLVELKQLNYYPEAQLNLDFDGDGLFDVRIFADANSAGWWYYVYSYSTEWEIIMYSSNDTLLPMNEEGLWFTSSYWFPYDVYAQETYERFAVRHLVGNSYYYGWFRAYILFDSCPWAALDKIAYCTIPYYPLVWGQTSVTGMEENGVTAFATLHPNPTSGLVTITGQNIRQAVVFNTLGQQVATTQGEGDDLRIDMATLPIGVYFITVTDAEGRKCVKKVVKE